MILDDITWTAIDTETTGTDPTNDQLVEIAALKYVGTQEIARFTTLVNPGRPIPPESSGVHHITDDDVVDAPAAPEALRKLEEFVGRSQMLTAHNAAFDRRFLTTISEPQFNVFGVLQWDWLCTWRLARHLLPHAPNHRLGTLRYLLRLDVARDLSAHRALSDVTVSSALTLELARQFEAAHGPDADLDELLDYAQSRITVAAWPFGRYYGQPIDAAPDDYIRWVLTRHDRAQSDLDLRKSLEAKLLRRVRRVA